MYKLNNTTKQSPSLEVSASRASHIPWILYSESVRDRIHNSLPLVAILSQINPIHTPFHPIALQAILILGIKAFYVKCHCGTVYPHMEGSYKYV